VILNVPTSFVDAADAPDVPIPTSEAHDTKATAATLASPDLVAVGFLVVLVIRATGMRFLSWG
jgi:hypothetical protein